MQGVHRRGGGVVSTDLERFRDHARHCADWQPGDLAAACKERTAFGTPKPADHANCGRGWCGCPCHAPTDAERALWGRLADEVDRWLTEGLEEAQAPDEPLWGHDKGASE